MRAIPLFVLVATVGFMNAPHAQTRDERVTEPPRKKSASPSMPDTVKPKAPAQPSASQPRSSPPHRTRVEREHEPRPTPGAQPTRDITRPPERDASLARCDDLRRRMENAMREEMRGGSAARMQQVSAERRSIYEQQLRAGCI